VEKAAYGFDRLTGAGCLATDPLERLVDGVRVGEHVVRGFPVRMPVGSAETRHPERRRISECLPEVGGRGAQINAMTREFLLIEADR
jgi:hypothetical protein